MKPLIQWAVERPRTVITAWAVSLCLGAWLSLHLGEAIRGSTDAVPGSPSDRVEQAIRRSFGSESGFVFPVLVESGPISVHDPRFECAVKQTEQRMTAAGHALAVRHFWNGGGAELLGADLRSALILVTPRARTFYEAEIMVEKVRGDIVGAHVGPEFAVSITGPVAVLHDMNRHSADDLLAAERIAIPVILVILLVVFGAPGAAALPVGLALIAVLMSLGGLYALSLWLPVSVFARNAVTMIGLGVGVDYALFVLRRFRDELAEGHPAGEAAVRAATLSGGAVLFSGMVVAGGFLTLLLVNIPLMHSLAFGGALVVAVAVAVALTLLPVLLAHWSTAVHWPRAAVLARETQGSSGARWNTWAGTIMRHPWIALGLSLAVLAPLMAPVLRMELWNAGAKDLPLAVEARRGAEVLKSNFAAGWLGPVVLAVQIDRAENLWTGLSQDAVLAIARRMAGDPRVALVSGFPAVLSQLGPARASVLRLDDLPASQKRLASEAVARSGEMALMVLIPRHAPESAESRALIADLRRDAWPEARAAGLTVGVAGAPASIVDFDEALRQGLWRVIPASLLLTFVMLLAMFRSLVIPLKATLLNLSSVLASWGFLILVFQDGRGAALTGIQPPGGLSLFIVLMLFTILFGLSMDYELFLLSRIKEEHERGADNATAVTRGLVHTGATISSAALIMVCVFGAFALTELTVTREFGAGLAFAVALDATLIRFVIVPASMRLLGEWNWWLPRFGRRMPTGSALTALDETFRHDPYPVLDQLRARCPVHRDHELKRWFITGHDHVRQVLRDKQYCVDARKADEDSFARRIAGSEEQADAGAEPSMLGLDDPDHRRLRSFVARAFAPKTVEALRPSIERVVDEAVDGLRGRAHFDLVGEYAAPIPFRVLAGMLGVLRADEGRFREWADCKVLAFDPFRSAETSARMRHADAALRDYFARAIAQRRAQPRGDLLSDLVQANEEGETLSESEIVTMCNLLIVAGIVTTTDLICNGIVALLNHPEQYRKLRERPDLIGSAVEEMLRFDSPVIQTGRIASSDVTIGGERICKGESISLSIGAANRDPRAFAWPNRFDIEREPQPHAAFGGGVHLCLGASLARAEAQIAISRLLHAFPVLRLSDEQLERKRLPVLNGWERVILLAR